MAASSPDFSLLTKKNFKLAGLSAQQLQKIKEYVEYGMNEFRRLIKAVRKKQKLFVNNNNAAPRAQPYGINKRKAPEISDLENAGAIKRPKPKGSDSSGLGSGQKQAETLDLIVQPKKRRKPQASSGSGIRRPRVPPYSSKYSPPPGRVYSLQDKQLLLINLEKALESANMVTKERLLLDLKIEIDEEGRNNVQFDFLGDDSLQKVQKFINYVVRNTQEGKFLNSSDEPNIDVNIISQMDRDMDMDMDMDMEMEVEVEEENDDEQQSEGTGPGDQILPNRPRTVTSNSTSTDTSGSESPSESETRLSVP